uniref:Uncharacterized protein n=1 Tax=Noctiluca scintillans TaxID=2966 RepID=A0A7S0ZP44_NOCSC|mmetsp:Transcript_12861/g.35531  ORF Transcript_12861/g.35531 Transcript_12861/m.35531 type:complete len:613 (+) Transcript_12861:35-1873(+)
MAFEYKELGNDPNLFWRVCIFILGIELAERLCYYTFAGSQEYFLEDLNYSVLQSSGVNAAFATLCYVWPLVGGYLADSRWGRFRTILIFAVFYVLGALISSIAAQPGEGRSGVLYMIGTMGFLAVGTGGIKPNIANFGADQYDVSTPEGRLAQEKFYNHFYVAINIGALFAYGFMTTLCSSGLPGVVPQEDGYVVGYGLGSGAMVLALICFICRRRHYTMKPPGGDALLGVMMHVGSAARAGSWEGIAVFLGWPLMLLGVLLTVVQSFYNRHWLLYVAVSTLGVGFTGICVGCSGDRRWLDRASKNKHLRRQHTADFLRVMPVLFTASIGFNALYNVMSFWYQQQACQMDNRLWGGYQLNGSFYNVMDCVAIIAITPPVLKHINPFFDRMLGGLTRHGKLLIGISLAAISVLLAAWMEVQRRAAPVLPTISLCAPAGVHMSDYSGFWIMIPYGLMGAAEVYVNPTLYHLSYAQTPQRLRSVAQAICLLMTSVSTGMFTLLTAMLPTANDLNKTHFEYGYYVSAVMAIPFLIAYCCVQKNFVDKDFDLPDDQDDEMEPFKEVAYTRINFFKDFPSPRSPWNSPSNSPVPTPIAIAEGFFARTGDDAFTMSEAT